MYRSDDDKIVSISFDNRQFLNNVSTTLKTIDQLNEATSERNLNGKGLNTLSTAFNNLGTQANSSLSGINDGFKKLTVPEQFGKKLGDLSLGFTALEAVALGVFANIGKKAADMVLQIPKMMTSGIRDGWGEYNLLMDSTQTILANTEAQGTTINDVTRALDELNTYADKTIYNFSQMTKNIGYFTTAGQNLDDSVMAIRGMANMGAFFGADAAAVSAATYQMSQAMSAGVVRLMDWRSLTNRSMGGKVLQEELMKVAGFMSGQGYDAIQRMVEGYGDFNKSLESGWLTADVFMETMRRFAGESREYWESLTNSKGEHLTKEEIDSIMELSATAEEAATKVRTFKMLIDSLKESVGSGWSKTFELLIGNLEQAKEFWTPINNLLTGIVGGIGDWRNAIVKSWADVWRTIAIEDMMTALEGIGDIFKAIGTGISRAFGSTHQIAGQIGRVTEALGDFATTLRLDEDELADLTDFVEGILAPITLLLDIFREITILVFNAGDAMNEFDTRTDSLADNIRVVRKAILQAMGIFGRILQAGIQFIRENDGVRQGIHLLADAIKTVAGIINDILSTAIIFLYNIWEKYNIGDRIATFCGIAIAALFELKNALYEIGTAIYFWISDIRSELSQTRFANPLTDLKNLLLALRDIFIAIVDPTKTVAEAFENFKNVLGIGSKGATSFHIWTVFGYIHDKLLDLYAALKDTPLGDVFNAIANIGSRAFEIAKIGFGAVANAATGLAGVLKKTKIGGYLEIIKNGFISLYSNLSGLNIGGILLGIASSISDAFDVLMESIGENGFVGAIVTFIKNVKENIETRISFRTPNVFTAIGTVASDIKEATTKLTDFREFNSKLNSIRSTVDNVKGVIDSLMPTENSKNASHGATVIKDILDFVDPVSDQSERIGKKIKDVTDALDTVASVDTEAASENTQKIAAVIAGFVGIFKYLVDMFLTIVAVLSIFNFSKWSDVIKTALDDMTVAISDGFGGIAVAINNVVGAINKSITAFSGAIREKFRAEEFKAVAEIFKTLAILVGIIFIGVTLVSQFGDPEALSNTMITFGIGLGMILGAIAITVGIVMAQAKSLTKVCMLGKISTFAVLGGLSIFMWSLRSVVTSITMVTAAIFAMAVFASKLENQDAFYNALTSLTLVFTFMISILTLISFVFIKLAESTELLDLTGVFGSIKTVASITAAATALNSIMGAMSVLMLAFSLSAYVLSKIAPNSAVFDKVISALNGLIFGLLGISALIALIAAAAPTASAMFSNVALTLLGLSAAAIGFGIAASGVILALGYVSTGLIAVITLFVTTLSNVQDVDAVIKPLYSILIGLVIVMAAIVAAMVILSDKMSKMGVKAIAGMASMLVFAAAIFTMSKSLILIATAIDMIVSLNKKFRSSQINSAANNLTNAFINMALALGLVAVVGSKMPLYAVDLVATGAAMMLCATSFIIIAKAIKMLAEAGKEVDINEAADLISQIGGLSVLVLGVLSIIGGVTGPIGIAAILGAATAMLEIAAAVLFIGEALKRGADGFYRYAEAAKFLEKVNVDLVYDKIVHLADTIPEVIDRINDSMGDISDIISKGIRAIAYGIVDGLYATYQFLAGILSANSAAIIEFFGGILAGIIIGIVQVTKIVVEQLCKKDGPLWEILLILGDFMVDASDYIGYYGTLIIVGLFKGMLHAIQDLGWDVYIGDALGSWWASVKLKFAQILGYGNIEEAFAGIGMTWGFYLADGIVYNLQQMVDQILVPVVNAIWEVSSAAEEAFGPLINVSGHTISAGIEELQEQVNSFSDDIQTFRDNASTGYQDDRQSLADQAIARAQDAVDMAELLTETEDEYIAARRAAREEERAGAHDYYNPSQYYAAAAGVENWANTFEKAAGPLGNIGNIFNNIFNLGEGETLFDKISNLLGLGDGESIITQIGNALGLGDMGSMLDNPFEQAGEDAANAFDTGFSDQAAANAFGYDPSQDFTIDDETLGKYASALSEAGNLPDEVKHPVISPVMDSSGFKADAMDLMDWWNGKTYDQFAIDASKSVLLREQAEGDAATNGEVSISYTQINNSPKELSPIEIYRDTKNLLRGSGQFRLA